MINTTTVTYRTAAVATVASFMLLPPRSAHADAASDAFTEGMKKLATADYNGACTAFSRAEAARGPTVKIRYQLGRCNQERGQPWKAYQAFTSAAHLADRAKDGKRAAIARQRAKEVQALLPSLVLEAPSNAPPGMVVKNNGVTIAPAQLGRAMAVKPGQQLIEVSAPGMQTLSLRLQATTPGERARLVIPSLQPAGAHAPASTSPAPLVAPGDGQAPADENEPATRRRSNGLFWTGFGLSLGGGLLGASAAIGLGVSREAQNDPGGNIAGMVLGGAMLGVGIPFMIVFGRHVPNEPKAEGSGTLETWRLEPLVGPTSAGLRLRF